MPEGALTWIHSNWLGPLAEGPRKHCFFKVGMEITEWHDSVLEPWATTLYSFLGGHWRIWGPWGRWRFNHPGGFLSRYTEREHWQLQDSSPIQANWVSEWKEQCLRNQVFWFSNTVDFDTNQIMFPVRGHSEICFSEQIRAICNWYASCLYSASRINSSPEPYLYFAFVYQNFFFF